MGLCACVWPRQESNRAHVHLNQLIPEHSKRFLITESTMYVYFVSTCLLAVQVLRLAIEEEALKKEKKETVSKKRLEVVRRDLAELREKLQPLVARYEKERARTNELRDLQQKKELLRQSLEQAKARGDLARVADLKYGA